jgi:FkbM family methyltransferase
MHETVRQNLKENKITNVEVIPAAVGDQDSQIEIEAGDFVLDSSIIQRQHTKDYFTNKLSVPLLRLDTFMRQSGLRNVHFIKMDIEGAEELALRGFDQGLRQLKPKWSISSYHIDSANEPQHPKLTKLLRKLRLFAQGTGKIPHFRLVDVSFSHCSWSQTCLRIPPPATLELVSRSRKYICIRRLVEEQHYAMGAGSEAASSQKLRCMRKLDGATLASWP